MSRGKWGIALAACVVLMCFAGPSAVAETVVEAWRSPFGKPLSVSINPSDGSCWTATGRSIMHLAATGAILTQTDGFVSPWSVSVNPADGSCWVADYGSNQVVHLSAAGSEMSRGGGFDRPSSVSVNPTDGSCWVADTYNDQVVHLVADGTELWRGGGFVSPESVSVNPSDGSCWVAQGHQVVHLAASGTELWRGGVPQTNSPESVSVNPADGSCWVAEYGIRLTDSEVVHLNGDGSQLWQGGGFVSPWSVSVNPTDGSCWVGDIGQVVHLAASGAQRWLWRGDAFYAISVSVNPTDGSCWVADSGSTQVHHLSANGDELWRGGGHLFSAVAVNPADGSCFVADTDVGQVVHLTIHTDFNDVPYYQWAFEQIESCKAAGIVAGYPDGTYLPGNPVTRDQMAVYVSRALAKGDVHVPTGPATPSFPDVAATFWAYKYIEYCRAQNVVQGYPDGTYQPSNKVTRDQMVVYIARSVVTPTGEAGLATYIPPTTPDFPDVPTTFWAYKYVEYCKGRSIVAGYPDGTYQPAVVVTRDQMAVYVQRAFQLPL